MILIRIDLILILIRIDLIFTVRIIKDEMIKKENISAPRANETPRATIKKNDKASQSIFLELQK